MHVSGLNLPWGGAYETWRRKTHQNTDKMLVCPPPAEPRGEKKLFFVQILGGEKLLKFGEKWAVKYF